MYTLGSVPFAASSSWNTPIPAGSTYTKIAWPATTGYNYSVNWSTYSPAVYVASATDPLVTVSYPYDWGWPGGTISVRVPVGATGAVGSDGEIVIIDGDTVHNFWQFNRTSNTTATAQAYGSCSVTTGSGWGSKSPFLSAGITGAGASEFAGLLVQAETNTGSIKHAIQLVPDGTLIHSGFTGEAIAGDGSATPGIVTEGDRLAIPPTVAMPTGLSPLGQQVFTAMQKYGAFVVDQAGGVTTLRAQANAYDAATITNLWYDTNQITPLLQAVKLAVIPPPPPPPPPPVVTNWTGVITVTNGLIVSAK